MPSPVRGQSGDRPLTQIPSALADMLAAALRGGVKATMGMPGDLEGLGRAGLNKLGADVDPTPTLPTSDFMNEWLPSDGGRMPTAEKLGEFLPLPATLGVGQAAKQVGPMVKALRGAEAPVDMGRRGALQTMGKAGAGAAAATVAPHMMVEALRGAPEAGAVAKAVAPTVAKAATRLTPALAASSLKNVFKFHAVPEAMKELPPQAMDELVKHFSSVEELRNADEWFGLIDKHPGNGDPEKMAKAWKFLDELPDEKVWEVMKNSEPGKLPKEWADAGVEPYMLGSRASPGGSPDPFNNIVDEAYGATRGRHMWSSQE